MSAPTLIALISQKGGSGKTTVAMQLAAGLVLAGHRVALADLDPQESASRWAESAPPETPFPAQLVRLQGKAKDMAKTLKPVANGVDVVVMDCPPSIEHPHTMNALELCDLALVPVVPSPTDLWATRGIERLILDRQRKRPALRGALLPNRVMRTSLAGTCSTCCRISSCRCSMPPCRSAVRMRSVPCAAPRCSDSGVPPPRPGRSRASGCGRSQTDRRMSDVYLQKHLVEAA